MLYLQEGEGQEPLNELNNSGDKEQHNHSSQAPGNQALGVEPETAADAQAKGISVVGLVSGGDGHPGTSGDRHARTINIIRLS